MFTWLGLTSFLEETAYGHRWYGMDGRGQDGKEGVFLFSFWLLAFGSLVGLESVWDGMGGGKSLYYHITSLCISEFGVFLCGGGDVCL